MTSIRPPYARYRRRLLSALPLLAALLPVTVVAAASLPEYQVKAAFLFNFAKFVSWPEPPSGEGFDICIVGRDPFGQWLDQIVEGKRLQGRPVRVRRLAAAGALDAAGCRIAFLDPKLAENAPAESLEQPGLLYISETSPAACEISDICFHLQDNKVRFDINLELARRHRLNVSSRLLRVAREVHQ